jgi:flagellar hook-associated protein 2
MPVQLTGLGGFDSAGVIDQLVNLANQPLRDIDSKKSLVDSASLTLNSFSSKLTTLKTAATALSTTTGFSSMAATSSDAGIVASVSGAAVASSYTLNVTQLARAQKSRSDAQASATAALGQTGSLKLQIGSNAVTVNVLATDSLSDIASKIGQSGARVSAAVINTGGSYRLSVQGLDTGAANAFTISETGVSLGLSNPSNVFETAQDAVLTVDGLTITRDTNQVTGAVPGVTLALTKTTTSPATVRIAGDSTALKSKISAFVSAYNDIVSSGHSATGYGTAKASNSVLAGDSSIRRSLDRLSSLVTGPVSGATGNYKSLSSVGVSLSRDGAMSFDGAKLDAALEKDPDAVRRLFITDSSIGATGLMKTLSDTVTSLISGDGAPVKTRIDALAAQSKRLIDSRAAKEKRVADYQNQLRRQFSDLDIAMSRYQTMSNALGSIK